ncbi:hypothetical protein OUZ56_018944 [Daphnia magna]|uniref:Uncharacterized protein n=1 Tax=Daphnia magna TaxID=35525 RepID=A0ABQ9ZA74_9CRUS|nr:hypothetical protein OUZ56_018944 [Daphnia magna]
MCRKINVPIPDTDDECLKLLVLANEDILSITDKKPHLKESPFLTCVGSLKNPICFNIVYEGEVLFSGTSSIKAFKNHYASFQMFRIKYPALLNTLYPRGI